MTLLTRVEVLQGAILVICVLLGRVAFHLSWRVSAIVTVVVLPAPLLQVSPGVAGFIYAGDVIGLLGSIVFVLNERFRSAVCLFAGRALVAAIFVLLLAWPAATTLISMLCAPGRDPKLIAVGIGRGITYFGVFTTAIYYSPRIRNLGSALTLQLCGLVLVFATGVCAFRLGADTDLWNLVAKLNPGEYSSGFGGGLMGLYRGAVGAWVAAGLGISPIVLMKRRIGWLLTPAVAIVLLAAALITGSRQGTIVGIGAFALGVYLSVLGLRITTRLALLCKTALVLVALGGLGYYWLLELSSPFAQSWVIRRLGFVFQSEDIVATAFSRDSNIGGVLDKLADDPIVAISGVGFGSIVDALPGGSRDLVYVDSELVWSVQQGGIVLVGLYLVVLGHIGRTFLRMRKAPHYNMVASAAFVALCVGCCFLYGHFFLLHVHSSEAPIALWHWLLYGAVMGVPGGVRLRKAGSAHVRSFALQPCNDRIPL